LGKELLYLLETIESGLASELGLSFQPDGFNGILFKGLRGKMQQSEGPVFFG
jgi:hypothetical protein